MLIYIGYFLSEEYNQQLFIMNATEAYLLAMD